MAMAWYRVLAAVLVAALSLTLVACGGSTARKATAAAEAGDVPKVYQLAAGDRLRINVFGHPDVSGEFEVDGDGSITFPLLGQVAAAGRSVNELKTHVAAQLNENYLVNPRVSVDVLNYRPFYILGEVEKPGSYPYQLGMTVRQAVALAGGFTRRAVTSEVTLIRPGDEGSAALAAKLETRVLPGDTIEVDRRFF